MICVVGSCNTDMVVNAPRLPKAGETVLGGRFGMHAGGKGANQAVAAARGGGRVSLVGALGDDSFGRRALENYRAESIDVSGIRIAEGEASGVALIMVDERGENMIAVAPGANALVSRADIDAAEGLIAQSDLVLLQLEIPLDTVAHCLAVARGHGVRTVLNPAPCPPEGLPEALLSQVDLLIPNEIECSQLGGTDELDAAVERLRHCGVGDLIVTRGAAGVRIYAVGQNGLNRPALKVDAVDTVGAGDCFCALMAVGLDEGLTVERAADLALRGAALSVGRPGAQPSFPTRAEIEAFRPD